MMLTIMMRIGHHTRTVKRSRWRKSGGSISLCKNDPDADGQCDRNTGPGSHEDEHEDAADEAECRTFDSVMHVLFLFSLHEASHEPMLLMMMSSVMEMRMEERMFSASSSTPDQSGELLAGLRLLPSHCFLSRRAIDNVILVPSTSFYENGTGQWIWEKRKRGKFRCD